MESKDTVIEIDGREIAIAQQRGDQELQDEKIQ